MSEEEKKMVVLMKLILTPWAAETYFQCPVGIFFLFYLSVWASVSSFHTPSGQGPQSIAPRRLEQMPPYHILQQDRDKEII